MPQAAPPPRAAGPSAPRAPRSGATRSEDRAQRLALVAAVLGGGAGLLTIRQTLPLFGSGAIGEHAALAAAATSGLAFVAAALQPAPRGGALRGMGTLRRVTNVVAVALLHAVFSLLLISVLFSVFADAFRGVALDRWAGAFWVAAASGMCTYIAAVSASDLSTRSLSVILAAFVVIGVLVSAQSAPDPHWWQHHFSALGTVSSVSGLTFNSTLLLAGIALVSIGDFLGYDLGTWARSAGEARWKVGCVRAAIVVLGVLLALVALIPVNAERTLHDAAAQSMVVVFAVALVAIPILLRRLPGGLREMTTGVIALLVALLVLWKGVHYLRITAFELGAGAVILAWLLLFTRIVGAAAADLPDRDARREEAGMNAEGTRA